MNKEEIDIISDSDRVFKVLVVAPTCFYYQSPLFQELARNPRIDLKVYFCSAEALNSEDVAKAFSTNQTWQSEDFVLSGFEYEFLRNFSFTPSYLNWPFGLINFGISRKIKDYKPDAVVLMAWVNVTWWVAIIASLVYRIPFLYMTDANIADEVLKSRWKTWLKRIVLSHGIFRLASGFLCAGTSNRKLYQHYGVDDERLFPFVYSWGYKKLRDMQADLKAQRPNLRRDLGIPEDSKVILYCGRFSPEKNVEQLLNAYEKIQSPKSYLALVGDGELRGEFQEIVKSRGLESVKFFGFQNRIDIAKFYAVSDLLVLPSKRETWGIVVNEALCFGLPVIVSDKVGSGPELISHGENGYIFPEGHTHDLADKIQTIINLPPDAAQAMSERSKRIIDDWLNRDLGEMMVSHLQHISKK